MQSAQVFWYAAIIATEIILLVSQLIPAIHVEYTLKALVFSINGHPKGLSLWRGVHEVSNYLCVDCDALS